MQKQHKPIFITGRFRSGTSFLWQLFNELKGFCPWYEPLHPQLLEAIKHVAPKQDHVGVSDYWQSYRERPRFKKYYSNRFATEHLYLEPLQKHPALKTYISHLLELSAPDIPVLQFNRADFRLPWLKSQFPEAVIVHIERNPIQLYESQRKHIDEQFRHQADYWDAYELAQWSYALSDHLPFMGAETAGKHAFYRFYLLYQLSRIMAKAHADVSINLDVDVFQGDGFVEKLGQVVRLSKQQKNDLKQKVNVPELTSFEEGLSKELTEIMTEVDFLLAEAGLIENFGQKSMTAIRFLHSDFWRPYNNQPNATEQLQKMALAMWQELLRIDSENQDLWQKLESTGLPDINTVNQFEVTINKGELLSENNINALLNVMIELNGQMTQVLASNRQLRELCENATIDIDEISKETAQ